MDEDLKRVRVEVSARHVHLSQADQDALFGPGHEMNVKKDLSQKGQWAAEETVTAVEQTETQMLLREDVLSFARTSPDLAMALVHTLTDRLRRTDDWLDDAYFADLDTRLANRLLELADVHGEETAEGIVVDFPLTQSDLAGMLGATRARVNRMLGIYQDAGLLRLGTGAFTILDREGIEDRAVR